MSKSFVEGSGKFIADRARIYRVRGEETDAAWDHNPWGWRSIYIPSVPSALSPS